MNKQEREKYIAAMPMEQRQRITEAYMSGAKIMEIIKKENLPFNTNTYREILLPQPGDKDCPYCNHHMVYIPNRSQVLQFCPNCGHEDRMYCYCENCNELRRQAELRREKEIERRNEEKRNRIIKFWCNPIDPVSYDSLSGIHKVWLGALIMWNESWDAHTIRPLSSSTDSLFTPWQEADEDIIEELLNYRILVVDPKTNIEAFSDNGELITNLREVSFRVNVEWDDVQFNELDQGRILLSQEDKLAIWRDIYVWEGIQYLNYRLDLAGYHFNPHITTKNVFADISENYSSAQLIYIIQHSYKNALTRIQEGKAGKKRGINSIITYAKNYAINAKKRGWNIPEYKREKNIIRSTICFYWYTFVLECGDQGFYLPVTEKSLESIENE